MKKKVIFTLITLLLIAFTLCGCNLSLSNDDPCSQINECAKKEYTHTNLEVQTTYNGVTLTNKFNGVKGANSTVVSYSTEELATIEKGADGAYIVPSEMIVKKSGNATIRDGIIVEQNGDAVSIPVENIGQLSLEFDWASFSESKTYAEGTSNVFEAKVKNVTLFTGNPTFDGKDMSVVVRYNDKLEKVVIDYTSSNGAAVKVIYTFM